MNKNVFGPNNSPNTLNDAGGSAHTLSNKEALALYAMTGTFNSTYYVDEATHAKRMAELTDKVRDNRWIAKLAVYASEKGQMKDMPAYLAAVLAARGQTALLKQVFKRVCNTTKKVLNFAAIIRSGVVGRKSFGTAIKALLQEYLQEMSSLKLFRSSIGIANPSLTDLTKMVHPRFKLEEQNNMIKYMLGKDFDYEMLPGTIVSLEQLKRGNPISDPSVYSLPFQVFNNIELGEYEWANIAVNMSIDTLRQNLNQLARRGVFNNGEVVANIASKLSNSTAHLFPYRWFTTYQNLSDEVPQTIKNAVAIAAQRALFNVPALAGPTFVAVDCSGSMSSPITGVRKGSTSVTTCVEGAAVLASALLATNPNHTKVVLFDTDLYEVALNPLDSVLTNAQKIARHGGGTDVGIPFTYLNSQNISYDNVVIISDNESWCHDKEYRRSNGGYDMASNEYPNRLWKKYHGKFPNSRLANIDLIPNTTTQTKTDKNILNCGSLSDATFEVLYRWFVERNEGNMESIIESVTL